MAGLDNFKITHDDFSNKDITGLPDKPSEAGMSAEDLKNRFDASTKYVVMPRFNELIDLLAEKVAKSIAVDKQDDKGIYKVTVTMYDDTAISFDLFAPTNLHNVSNDAHADIRKLIQTNAENIQSLDKNKAPAYTYGTTDLIEGVSPLPTGTLYFVYE